MPLVLPRPVAIPRFADESELRAWVNALDEDAIAAFYDSQAVASEAEQAYMDEVFDEAWSRLRRAGHPHEPLSRCGQ